MDLGPSRSLGKSAPWVRTFIFGRWPVLVVAVGLICNGAARAQLFDSLGLFVRQPPHVVVKLDSRGSFISNSNVRFMGVKLGLEHAGRFQYGIGYSFLMSGVESLREVEGEGMLPVRLRLGYACPYVEYAFYERGHWEVRIPVQFGLGSGTLLYDDEQGRNRRLRHAFIFLYEPAMTVQYRFLRYFGLNAGWGYRLVFSSADLGERLTAPTYTFGLKVFFGDLWRDLHR